MKKFLTLFLIWVLAFSAIAETTFKAKTALSAAGGYITSLNKVDGSFEDGASAWSASVGTITAGASALMQGNNRGTWSGTGAGTLDLQWTATATNTYEVSALVDVQGEDDFFVCAYVNTTETGCKAIPALTKAQKLSVVVDSVISTPLYFRLKHTGSDAFIIKVDDGKIEPWTPQAVNLNLSETISYNGYTSGTTGGIKFKTLVYDSGRDLISDDNSGSFTKITASRECSVVIAAGTYNGSGNKGIAVEVYNSSGVKRYSSRDDMDSTLYASSTGFPFRLNVGDYVLVKEALGTPTDVTDTFFSISASSISESIITSYQDGTEWKALTYTEVNALSGNQGFGTFTAGGYEYKRDGSDLLIKGKLTAGTVAPSEARIPLPNGLVSSDTTRIPSLQIAGTNIISGTGAVSQYVLIEPSVSYMTFGQQYASGGGLAKRTGSDLIGTGVQISFTSRIPIQGWSSAPTLIALPTRSEVFSASVDASEVITNATQNFVTSCTNAAPSICTLWGNFGNAPICWAQPTDSAKVAVVSSSTTTQTTVARTDTSTAFNLFCHLK